MAKPYSFEAVIPTDAMIDLGTRLVQGQRGLPELKDAVGISGCILEKYDGPEVGLSVESSSETLEDLGDELRASAAISEGDSAEALNLAILLPLILKIIEMIIQFRRGGGEDGGPV
jgi:hypothetical protein